MISQAHTRKDKSIVYRILVQQYSISGSYQKAVEVGFVCLELYDLHITMNPTTEEVTEAYNNTKASILALPSMYQQYRG